MEPSLLMVVAHVWRFAKACSLHCSILVTSGRTRLLVQCEFACRSVHVPAEVTLDCVVVVAVVVAVVVGELIIIVVAVATEDTVGVVVGIVVVVVEAVVVLAVVALHLRHSHVPCPSAPTLQ